MDRQAIPIQLGRAEAGWSGVVAGGRWSAQDSDSADELTTVRRAGGLDSALLSSSRRSSSSLELVIGRSSLP